MRLKLEEKETIISYNEKDDSAIVYTCNVRIKNRLARLEEEYETCKKIREEKGLSVTYTMPKSWVKINPQRKLSDEQKKKMAELAVINLHRKTDKSEDE